MRFCDPAKSKMEMLRKAKRNHCLATFCEPAESKMEMPRKAKRNHCLATFCEPAESKWKCCGKRNAATVWLLIRHLAGTQPQVVASVFGTTPTTTTRTTTTTTATTATATATAATATFWGGARALVTACALKRLRQLLDLFGTLTNSLWLLNPICARLHSCKACLQAETPVQVQLQDLHRCPDCCLSSEASMPKVCRLMSA
ncbi:unnamed protein product [Polarella glacialis]|uniref:Uncharacterized protein n=1 Tax=Polarella glacialis TaxID=89957 RepID=A0A813DIY1_POLGL|nr:unnamed protein product [Polarella glacialis]